MSKSEKEIEFCPECGCVLGRARSIPDLRRFFGVLRQAWLHWPEHHHFQTPSTETFRGWALVQAAWCEVDFVPYPDTSDAPPGVEEHLKRMFRNTVEATLDSARRRTRTGYAELRISAGGAEILYPKSISCKAADQKEFNPVREAVEALLESVIGVSAQQLLEERAA